MPQSLSNVAIHLVFSTKDRRPFLQTPELRGVMTGYLIGILNNLECPSIMTGVVENHVHILCNLSRTISIASLVSNVKSSSSERIKSECKSVAAFYWQAGYGAFSVSQSNIERVVEYIAHQEEHHRKVSFQEELRALLNRHEIPFDEHYVWD